MAPVPLRRLIAIQNAHISEIELMSTRLRERSRDSLNSIIVKSRIDALNAIWTETRQTHADIVVKDDAREDPYMVDNVYARAQGLYEDTLDYLLTLMAQFQVAAEPRQSAAQTDRSVDVTRDSANLPKLDLPKFSGKYEDWESFSDLFITLVHSRIASDATKLSYLKLCLTGIAADLVKDVATTDANYATTWQALKSRFYNPRRIVSQHLNALMNVPHLKRESASDLRSFADEAQRIVRALANLKMPVDQWSIWFVHVLSARLDAESRKEWESELSTKDSLVDASEVTESPESDHLRRFPTFIEFAKFLEKRSQTLGMIAVESIKDDKRTTPLVKQAQGSRRVFHTRPRSKYPPKCELCSGAHFLSKCYKLKAKTTYDRRADVRRLRLCFNCFGHHRADACTSSGRCVTCREKHHTLLHFDLNKRTRGLSQTSAEPPSNNSRETNTADKPTNVSAYTASVSATRCAVLLATAQVFLYGPHGGHTRVRALLDQGAESSFVSEAVVQLLELPKRRANIVLTGLGAGHAGTARFTTSLKLQSLTSPEFKIDTEALILPRLASHLPARDIIELNLEQFAGLSLADPQFYIRDSVDLILGADVYGHLLRSGLQRFPSSGLIAQRTALGWIISGSVQSGVPRRAELIARVPVRALHCVTNEDLNDSMQQFWTLEELPEISGQLKPDEEACENQFRETHTRDPHGRYIVRLPLRSEPPAAGIETRRMALGSLSHMYRRFARDPKLAEAYREFMNIYESLGHMTRVPKTELVNPRAWYLPHHAVVVATLMRWRLRVVFDASRKIRDQQCLNTFLRVGQALQSDLSLVLLNWRIYRFVFTADVVKMFRQIRVALEDQDFQRILWAPNSEDAPVEYKLTTVTYGTACAPYLAIRTLRQLAQDERSRFPLGARCLENNTYVDDIFAGADELSMAVSKRRELTALLNSAGIELDKWAANHADLVPTRVKQPDHGQAKDIDRDAPVKTLGVQWKSAADEFTFSTLALETLSAAATKRSVLSNIARLFDPLGWLAPVTVTAKILMQDLWILKCDWDSPLPIAVRKKWLDYCNSLASLSKLSINRWLGTSSGQSYQIHGFSDASSRAYAAAVYLRVDQGNGNFRVSLMAAKSKVAPVKTVSIPNLELCGAVLLIRLICHVQKLDYLNKLPVHAWSDSQVVLMWIRRHPRSWRTFVANRVSFIQTELPSARWAHVPTKQNPADLATRGSKPGDLAANVLWWRGPAWLSMPSENWPQPSAVAQVMHSRVHAAEPEIFARYSSLSRLIRVVAYCLRPLVNYRKRKGELPGCEMSPSPPFLTTAELSKARSVVIKLAQSNVFAEEIAILKVGKALPKRNALRNLKPIVDNEGILRVGGRLTHSGLASERKNPPILPHRSTLSKLIVRQAHHTCLHGGPTLTASTVAQYAWILGNKRLIKTEIHHCIPCQRVKPRLAYQLMGDLPACRVTPARPFSTSGLDYAGPLQVRTTKGRGHRSYKGYVALFVCFATRAIHLELVSDCTSETFIAAFRRFVGRRGICRNLYSDNATTFHGADQELKNMFTAASSFYKTTASLLSNDGTDWTFIPPNAPHYGGLWEAGVKSMKHHLKRVIGEHTLTFEELTTVLVEIEACLNSRPLCPLNSDIDNLQVLTPAHFLIGETSGLIPDEDLPQVPENRLSRFQLLQRIRNNFWKRWSTEYLQHLQERSKWREPTKNYAVGQLV